MKILKKKNEFLVKILKIKYFKFLVFLPAFFIIALFFFIVGIKFDKNKNAHIIINTINLNWKIPVHFYKGWLAQPKDKLIIDIKHKNLLHLYNTNNHALKYNYGILNTINPQYKNAFFTHENNKLKGELRVKGNWIDSRSNNKLSLRIKLDDNKTIMGMNRFSIHDPKVKGFISEWLFYEICKYEDIISPRYDFINVSINGDNKGLFAIEEHFDKRLIENNKRKDGLILKIDEGNQLFSYSQLSEDFKRRRKISFEKTSYSISPIYTYNDINSDNDLIEQLGRATMLFESFRTGKNSVEEVFNVESLAKLVALCDLLGQSHTLKSKNIKFYLNPITSKIEPIAYDQHLPNKYLNKLMSEDMNILNYDKNKIIWPDQLFQNQLFFKKYIQFLNQFSERNYLDKFFNLINKDFEEKLNLTYKTNPLYSINNKKILYENQEFIKRKLNPKELTQSYLQKNKNGEITLKIGNVYSLPIEIIGMEFKGKIYNIEGDRLQNTKMKSEIINFKEYKFQIKEIENSEKELPTYKVVSKVLGTNNIVKDKVNIWPFNDIDKFKKDVFINPNKLSEYKFLNINRNKIVFNRKKVIILENLIIPKGFELFINEGTEIDLRNNSSIISYSPINALGSENYPINIFSSDSMGHQGLAVFNTKKASSFNYVNFKNLSIPKEKGWQLSGALTFYESDLNINHCIFSNNRIGDDFLNVVRSEFTISNSLFQNVLADSFDSDFSNGTIQNSSFKNVGNDAVDVSGSNISINNIIMENIADKGISAGEESDLNVNGIIINNSNIAVASKDNSKINLTNAEINNNKIGLTAFQKKNEFGPGSIIGNFVDINNTEISFLIEEFSYCKIDDDIIISEYKNLKDLIYKVK